MLPKHISIIAPTYNDAKNVVPFAERVKAALADHDWELFFVDDSSADGTAQRVGLSAR